MWKWKFNFNLNLFCRFEVEDLYKKINQQHIDLFDTSNYSREHFLFNQKKQEGGLQNERWNWGWVVSLHLSTAK